MGQIQTVDSLFSEDHFIVVKNFKAERSLHISWQVFTIFQKSDIDASNDVVDRSLNNLFFKYYSVLPRLVSVSVLNGFGANNFIENELV